MGGGVNIPTPIKPREPEKIQEIERFENTLVFINNVLENESQLDEKVKVQIKAKIDTKEIPGGVIILFPGKKDINVLKDRMENEMGKYPDTKKGFFSLFYRGTNTGMI